MAFLAILNPAAGGGRCGKLARAAIERLRAGGIEVEVAQTNAAGEGVTIVREAWRAGRRQFLAVGGDGTSYEIVNGLFPEALPSALGAGEPPSSDLRSAGEPPTLGFLPLGTGNSFLHDFAPRERALEHAFESLIQKRNRPADAIRATYAGGELYYINLLSVGFAADVAATTNRSLKWAGHLGYLLGVFIELARLNRRAFPLRLEGEGEFDRRRCLFLTFNNSKYTGGTMMIAPDADPTDGLIEYVRWGAIGRLGLIRNLHTLYDGTHVRHPLAERRGVRQAEFALEAAVNVMVDGESLELKLERIEVLPGALRVVV